MPHDIIDNRDEKLVEHIKNILGSTDSARFAVGYFFLSGLEAIQEQLSSVRTLRLLIGNTTNRETIEQISEGYLRLDLVGAAEAREQYLKRAEQTRRTEETAGNLRKTLEVMDQTDAGEALVKTLMQLIVEQRLEVKVYTKGRLHAKAYIFDYHPEGHYEKGIAIVGSSNLTLSGLAHNTELNVVVHGNENHERLGKWFDQLWEEAQDFDAYLMKELQLSWAGSTATPYDVYMKSLHALVADRLDDTERGEILWDDELTRSLADFQKTAVRQAVQMIRDHGGAFVSDVVGLGKSYIGAAVLKHFVRTQGARPLIICPKALEEMWTRYNDEFDLNAKILPMSMLKAEGWGSARTTLDDRAYKERDFVLIDESHNFRHHSAQRYEVLADFLSRGLKKVCLLTATPRNSSVHDVYHQIKLFHPDDITSLPIDPPNLKDYFKAIEKGQKRLQELLAHVLIRRTRKHIVRWYGYSQDKDLPLRELSESQVRPYLSGDKKAYVMVGGRHQYFPKRELGTLRYSIEDTYAGLYDRLRTIIGRADKEKPVAGLELTYARYGLWNYVRDGKKQTPPYQELQRSGYNLRGLVRVMLFKRFESSVYAFRKTLERLERIHGHFLEALTAGFVPAGQEAQKLMYQSDELDEADLMDALKEVSDRYAIEDFDVDRLRDDILADQKLLQQMITIIEPVTPDQDSKLQTLLNGLSDGIPQRTGKVLIFSQFADTAQYLYDNINPDGLARDIESIIGKDKSKARMAARFSPLSNSQFEIDAKDEVRILVATDVMSEGLNLQDGDVVVNYDLHWNPVRLIQRFGRIDRIGTENEVVCGFNFLPETNLESNLGLTEVLKRRIQEIHDSIGEDAAILDNDEQLNEEAMFAIYEEKGTQLHLFEEEDDFLDIGEAEELLRTLRQNDPDEYARIVNLRDGIRSARGVFNSPGRFVFCQAGRFQQVFLLDTENNIVTRDVGRVLGRVKCPATEPTAMVPADHNAAVMSVLRVFSEEVRHRRAQQKYGLSITTSQAYALRELKAHYSLLTEDEVDLRAQISKLEEAFRRPATAAIRRQLNMMRRNGMIGAPLIKALTDLYHDHGLHEVVMDGSRSHGHEADEFPRVICSEVLV